MSETEILLHNRREHLFISYATEDAALADWLTLRLTAAGYQVWCDRFQLLGGEPWPQDIDSAIKERSFRLLQLLSRASANKPNPTKEREIALAISREREIPDFFIPLNVDGIGPADLPWRVADINYIPFQDWGAGLKQLLRKLEAIAAPRPIAATGARVAAEAYLPPHVLSPEPEEIITNCVLIQHIPKVIQRFRCSQPLGTAELRMLRDVWPARQIDERLVVAFDSPPSDLPAHLRFTDAGRFLWAADDRAHGIYTPNLVSELIRKAANVFLYRRGLRWSSREEMLFVPPSTLQDDRLRFTTYSGKETYVKAGGDRTFGGERFRYRLGVSLYVRQDLIGDYALILRPRLHITDPDDEELGPDEAFVRRKRVARSWFNHEWVNRVLALFSLFEGTDGNRAIAPGYSGEGLVLAPRLQRASVSPSVVEERLLALGHAEADPTPADEEDEDEGAADEAELPPEAS